MAASLKPILISILFFAAVAVNGASPPTCERIECPEYKVVDSGNGFEIRLYESAQWTSTDPIDDISLVEATRTGFLQ